MVVISLILTIQCIFDKNDSKSKFRGVEKVFGRSRIFAIVLDLSVITPVVRYQEVGRLTARRESHTNIVTLVRFYCSTEEIISIVRVVAASYLYDPPVR